MPAQWTAEIIGKMHLYRISKKSLAEHLGMRPEYISMILNGHRDPPGAEARFQQAVMEIIQEKGESRSKEIVECIKNPAVVIRRD